MDRSMSLDSPPSPDDPAGGPRQHRPYLVSSSSSSPEPRAPHHNPFEVPPSRSRSAARQQEAYRVSTSSPSSSGSSEELGEFHNNPFVAEGEWRGGSSRGSTARGWREEVPELTRMDAATPDEFYNNPFVAPAGAGRARDAGGAPRKVAKHCGRGGRAGREAAAESRRAQDERVGTSEPSSCSDRSTLMQEGADVDALRQQVNDLGKQLWQMHKEHEEEKSKMRDDFEAKLKEVQEDNEAKIGKLRAQLREKDNRLKEGVQRSDQLEWEVEELQLRMQNAFGGRQPYGEPPTSARLGLGQKLMGRERINGHGGFGRTQTEHLEEQRAGERSVPNRCYTMPEESAGNFPQAAMLNSCTETEPHLPPKHLQQFSPLTMRRRLWSSSRGLE